MRLTFLALKLDIVKGGGANRGLDIKLRNLQARGHDVRLLTIFPELNSLPPEGVPYPVIAAPTTDRSFKAIQQHVVDLLRQYEEQTDVYDIEGTTFLWAGGMYRLSGGRVPVATYLPTYMEALNLLTYEPPDPSKGIRPWLKFHLDVRSVWIKHWLWSKRVGLKYARALDWIFVPSPAAGNFYAQFGFPAEKISALPEFIDREHFLATGIRGEEIPIRFDAQRPLRLLHVGRLLAMKGVDVLLRAVADLRRSGKHATVTILGDGPQRERLEKLMKKLAIEEAVVFAAWREEEQLAPIYANHDIFIHPCRFPEPLGRTIIEAMFFNRPIVTTAGSGSAWAAGSAGASAKSDDADDVHRVLADLYHHPEKLTALSKAAPERVKFFDVHAWTDVLEQTLSRLHEDSKRYK